MQVLWILERNQTRQHSLQAHSKVAGFCAMITSFADSWLVGATNVTKDFAVFPILMNTCKQSTRVICHKDGFCAMLKLQLMTNLCGNAELALTPHLHTTTCSITGKELITKIIIMRHFVVYTVTRLTIPELASRCISKSIRRSQISSTPTKCALWSSIRRSIPPLRILMMKHGVPGT